MTPANAVPRALRIARAGGRFAAASMGMGRYLLGVSWTITERCNARCPFCDRHSGPKGVDLDTALRVIDQLAEVGCERIHFTGGEPLVKQELAAMLRCAGERGIARSVNTNGILLADRPEVVREADAFLVSFDGGPAVHDGYRGEGAYDKAIKGLETLRDAGKQFALSVALFRQNMDELDHLLALAARFDVRVVLQPGATHIVGSREANPEMPDVERFRAIVRGLLEDESRRRHVWNSPRNLETLLLWPGTHGLRCHAGRITCRIEVDGSMYPCSRALFDERCQPAPNAYEEGVAEAFARLSTIDCSGGTCWSAHNVEKNLLFSYDVASWTNLLTRNYMQVTGAGSARR